MILFLLLIIIELGFLFKFKSIILQLFLIISILPQITLLAFSCDFPVPGVLMLNRDLFSTKTILTGNTLLACSSVLMICILYPLRNKIYELRSFTCTKFTYLTLLIVAFCSALISYPRVSGFDLNMDMSTIYISINVAMLLCKQPRNSVMNIIHLLILLFVIIGGDRVDSMASVVLVCILFKDGNIYYEKINRLMLYIGALGLFIIGLLGGLVRDGYSLTIESLTYSIYAQQTVSDVVFVFLSSIQYFYENGNTFEVLNNLLFGLFPGPFYGVVSPYNFTIYLSQKFATNPGGGLFVSEGILAFGPLGAIIYSILYTLIIRYLFKVKSRIMSAVFITLVIMSFRTSWYGMIYCYKPILFSILFCGTLIYISKGKSKETKSLDYSKS